MLPQVHIPFDEEAVVNLAHLEQDDQLEGNEPVED